MIHTAFILKGQFFSVTLPGKKAVFSNRSKGLLLYTEVRAKRYFGLRAKGREMRTQGPLLKAAEPREMIYSISTVTCFGFSSSGLGISTVRTPSLNDAFIKSGLIVSWSEKDRLNLPKLLSLR